jgi:hypothetical protein
MSKKSTSEAVRRSSLFGPPLVLEGEDSAAYDELVGRIYAAVKPVDVLDEMFIADVASLEWEVLRWRRLKFHLIRSHAHQAVTDFLDKHLNYDLYREEFTEDLSEILESRAPEDQAKGVARDLAHNCARNQTDAVLKVREILVVRYGTTMDIVLNEARKRRAGQLAQEFGRGERRAITLVQQQLADAGLDMDALAVKEIRGRNLEYIERIDRLITIAESRRNSSLREIDRRRAALGQTLRRSVQGIEDDKLKVIETTPVKGKNAA